MASCLEKILFLFNTLLCIGIIGWSCPILYENRKIYLDDNYCKKENDEISKILFCSLGLGILGIFYKCMCCGLDKILYAIYIFLGITLISFNLNFYNNVNSTCISYYKSNYSDLWDLYIGSIVYLFGILIIGIINLIRFIYEISYCSN